MTPRFGAVAVEAAGAGLRFRAADEHDVLGTVFQTELPAAEVAREEQRRLIGRSVEGIAVEAAAAEVDPDLAAIEDAAVGRAVGLEMDLVVHAEGVPAVTPVVAVRDRVPGARLDEELGVAAEHDLDVGSGRRDRGHHNTRAHERSASQQQLVLHDPVLHSHPQGRVST